MESIDGQWFARKEALIAFVRERPADGRFKEISRIVEFIKKRPEGPLQLSFAT